MTAVQQLGIRPPADPGLGLAVDAVVASMPMSLATDPSGPLVAIAGAGEWVEAATVAIAQGACGVVVDTPAVVASATVEALIAAAEGAGACVVLRMPWASHPAVADATANWAPIRDQLVVADSLITGTTGRSLAALAVDQLYLVSSILGPLRNVAIDVTDSHGYALRARSEDGVPVSLTAIDAAGPSTALLRLLGRTEAFELSVENSATWRPAVAFRASDQGENRRPPIFESADRFAWRTLHRAVVAGETPRDLRRFADALGLIEAAGGIGS